jgi:1-pyrroline-5-carboxylate dehydrogenase
VVAAWGHTPTTEQPAGRPPVLDASTSVPTPVNEPIRQYVAGSPERSSLELRLKELAAECHDLPTTIDGVQRMAAGDRIEVVQPHRHAAVLGVTAESGAAEWQAAVDAALGAAAAWRETSYDDRAAVLLKAAALLSGPWRDTLNAATMLGQSKTVLQAEIDSACELIDFLRFNVAFGRQVLAEQPVSSPGVWNRMDHRPLEGFVLAITPFNFTAIAGNLPLAPALMGNTVVWKPSPTQQLAAHFTMRLLEAAGLPPGVINMVTGFGTASSVALEHPDLAGIHFTGSTPTFQHLWQQVGRNIAGYRSWRTPPPTSPPSRPPWCGVPSSTRGRSARRPRGPTCPARCGRAAYGTHSPTGCGPSSTATSPIWPTSAGP